MPEAVRHLTSSHVIAVEKDLSDRLAARAAVVGVDAVLPDVVVAGGRELGVQQRAVVQAITGTHQLVVIEGAAGAGKTTALLAAKEQLAGQGRRQMVVAPTVKAAKEAALATGSQASSIHKLLHQHGWRWDDTGQWSRLAVGDVDAKTGVVFSGPSPEYVLDKGTQVVVDEAGMIDQDTARALLSTTDEAQAPLVLMGDRAQLAAVGRGGVLDKAVLLTGSHVDVDEVHRFTDPDYAALTVRMRDREEPGRIFDELVARGQVHIHTTEEQAFTAMSTGALADTAAGRTVVMSVPTNDAATVLNGAVRDARLNAGLVTDGRTTTGSDGVLIGRGDLVMTRRNDTDLGVANRDLYTVAQVHRDGGLVVVGTDRRRRTLTPEYVAEKVHLGYATTAHGNQGTTVDTAHTLLSPGTGAAGVYVPMTRGRDNNTLHVIAVDQKDAREQFIEAMTRESGDRGLDAARKALTAQTRGLDLAPDIRTRERRILDTVTARRPDLTGREAEYRRGRVAVLEKWVVWGEARQKTIVDVTARLQREKDWTASGKPTLEKINTTIQDLAVDQKAAETALAEVRTQHAAMIGEAWQIGYRDASDDVNRVIASQKTVDDAKLFSRRDARAGHAAVLAEIQQRTGHAAPVNWADGSEWAKARANDAQARADAEGSPAVTAAEVRVDTARQAAEAFTADAARLRAEWTANVTQGQESVYDRMRAAGAPEAGIRARQFADTQIAGTRANTGTPAQQLKTATQELDRAQKTIQAVGKRIDAFDNATPDGRTQIIDDHARRQREQALKEAAAQTARAAESQRQQRSRDYYNNTPSHDRDRGGPSLGR
jgi:hypothetical protein